MKKGLFILLWIVLWSLSIAKALEIPVSFGGGAFMNLTYENDNWTVAGVKQEDVKIKYGGWGAWAFLDAAFLELSLGLGGSSGVQGLDGTLYEGSGPVLQIAALGKYPISRGASCVIYPLLGLDSQFLLGVMTGAGKPFPDAALEDAQKRFNSLWLKMGGGIDMDLSKTFYFRAHFLYGIKFYNEWELDFWESNKEGIQFYAFHGPTFKLAFGHKLHTFSIGKKK